MQDDSLVLIDFGLVTKYQDDGGNHLEMKKMKEFKGNLLFASQSILEFNRPSRKDDLISVCYFLLTMLNGGEFP